MSLWDEETNAKYNNNPKYLTCGAHKKLWWKCSNCGASFLRMPSEVLRTNRNLCKACSDYSKRISLAKAHVITGQTLGDLYPELVKEWLECEIRELTPFDVMPQSKLCAIWKCPKCSGLYKAMISNRTDKNSACPYCASQKVLKGYNDLKTLYPDIAQTWSEKNSIQPDEVTPHSNKVVYWKCDFGHDDFSKSVKLRVNGQGCIKCANALQTSFPEQAIYYYLKQIYSNAINRYKLDNKYEIDIFIPELKAGIEYNGYYYHKDKTAHDDEKRRTCLKRGINIITINEVHKGKKAGNQADLYINDNYSTEEFKILFHSLLCRLNQPFSVDVDISRDSMEIRAQYMFFVRENSILEKNAQVASEWDYEKNGQIRPDFVPYGSSQKFHWICSKCEQEFAATPKQRTSGKGCPFCARKKVKTGLNDLATLYPNLLKDWDYKKNTKHPTEVYAGGRTICYWICELGHSYACSIENRIKGINCLYCAGKKVLAGFNDLLSQKPDLVLDWDYAKNKISPDKVHANSFKKYFWKCHICGFEWEYNIIQRIKCPSCTTANKKINVYTLDGFLLGSYIGRKEMCAALGIQVKSLGNISSVCMRKQKTLHSKYILRYDRDDEFKGLSQTEIQSMIASYLGGVNYDTKLNSNINVYDIIRFEFAGTYNGFNELCADLGIKTKSNACSVCQRRQKSIGKRYILRYVIDDEFKGLGGIELKEKLQAFLNKK